MRYYIQNAYTSLFLPADPGNGFLVPITGSPCYWNFRVMPPAPFAPRLGISERYGHDGGRVSGDRKQSPRELVIEFDITRMANSGTWRDFGASTNLLAAMFGDGLGPYYLVETISGIRAQIDSMSISSEPASAGEAYTTHHGELKLSMLDSFWEDVTATTQSATMADSDAMTISNSSKYPAFPIITVTALADISSFRITNLTNGIYTELGSSAFTSGEKFVIDSVAGTIYLGSTNPVESSVSLADGAGLIQLEPGSNQLQYTSLDGSCSVQVSFRRRYPF